MGDLYRDFIFWKNLVNPEKGFINDDKITLQANLRVNKPNIDHSAMIEKIYQLEEDNMILKGDY